MRYRESTRSGRATVKRICKYLCRLGHHENPPPPESKLLDDMLDAPRCDWEHLWIDIGGEA